MATPTIIVMSMIFSPTLSISIPRDKNYVEWSATFRGTPPAQRVIAAPDADQQRLDISPFVADPQMQRSTKRPRLMFKSVESVAATSDSTLCP